MRACRRGESTIGATKQGHEVDFVLARRGQPPLAIECKWSANDFDAKSLKAFAARYPKAQYFVVAQDVDRAYNKHLIHWK